MRFRNWLMRVMAGRYGAMGMDKLNRALNIAALILLVLSLFLGRTGVGSLIWLLALACLVWGTFRSLSRNIRGRQRENEAFLGLTRNFTGTSGACGIALPSARNTAFSAVPPAGPGCGSPGAGAS